VYLLIIWTFHLFNLGCEDPMYAFLRARGVPEELMNKMKEDNVSYHFVIVF